MTDANEPEAGWPILPPPDLSETYASWPRSWQTGAVLLANRLLAAAYRAAVLAAATEIAGLVEANAVPEMTVAEYLDERTAGDRQVVDTTLALQCLQYSPGARRDELDLLAYARVAALARRCFREDVRGELERHGTAGAADLPEGPW